MAEALTAKETLVTATVTSVVVPFMKYFLLTAAGELQNPININAYCQLSGRSSKCFFKTFRFEFGPWCTFTVSSFFCFCPTAISRLFLSNTQKIAKPYNSRGLYLYNVPYNARSSRIYLGAMQ